MSLFLQPSLNNSDGRSFAKYAKSSPAIVGIPPKMQLSSPITRFAVSLKRSVILPSLINGGNSSTKLYSHLAPYVLHIPFATSPIRLFKNARTSLVSERAVPLISEYSGIIFVAFTAYIVPIVTTAC